VDWLSKGKDGVDEMATSADTVACQPSRLSTKGDVTEVIGAGEKLAGGEPALLCVTSGVTWGKPTFASASFIDCTSSKVQRQAIEARLDGIEAGPDFFNAANGLRGNFVETALLAEGGGAPKSLKNMVGTTGIEPVTPTMSR
jgi:hypothetical protein